jgi:hypothetical protein
MDTPTLSTVALPTELYRQITEQLYRPRDRPTLLSLSLTSTVWRQESQRILFKDIWDGCYDKMEEIRKKWFDTHLLFLQAICAQPDRLGPYVRSYGQFRLAWDSERAECKRSSAESI